MPLIARMEGGNSPLEAGTYAVMCTDIKPDYLENSQYDPNVYRFTLETTEVLDSDSRGIELTAISSRKLTPNSKLTRWVTALVGHIPEIGGEIDLEEVVGKHCLMVVVMRKSEQGGEFARVDDLIPAPKRATRTAPEVSTKLAQTRSRTPEQQIAIDESARRQAALNAENARMAGTKKDSATEASDEQMAYVSRLVGDLRKYEPDRPVADIRTAMGVTSPSGTRLTTKEVEFAIDWLKGEIEKHSQLASIPF